MFGSRLQRASGLSPKRKKNDWNDALAIAEAAQRPDRHSVGIKSHGQLDVQALHRVRQKLVTARTAIVNQVRGLLRERGLVFGSGRRQSAASCASG